MTLFQKIKLILRSVREYKKYAIITPLFMIGEILLECLLPFLMSNLIDMIAKLSSIDDFFVPMETTNLPFKISFGVLVFTLLGMAMLSLLCGILGGRYAAKAGLGMGANLRNDLYEKIQSFSFSNIDKFSASSLITRMTTDIQGVQMSFQMCIRIVVRAPLMLIFSAIMSIVSGGIMSLIFLGVGLIVVIGLILIVKNAMHIFRRVFKRYDVLNASVQENISGIRVVKTFVREAFEKKKFNTASDNITFDFVKAEKIVAYNNPLMNTSIHLSNVLVVGLGTKLICDSIYAINKTTDAVGNEKINILSETLTIGQLSAMITYGIQILTSLMMISMIMVMLVMSLESVNRICEVLVEEPSIKNPENPIMALEDGSVEFKDVDFKYSANAQRNALENINLSIKSGQFIGILGGTGSGKTSLVNLISRLYDITDGTLTVGGHDVKEYDLVTLRDSVSVVLQKNVLFSGTIRSNMQWGDINATDEEMMKALTIAQIHEINGDSEGMLDRKVEQGGSNFSGGQKQRLCIARAILKKPKILILDDSTSAVDTKTDRLIRKALKEDLPQITKIVIAQRISSIEDADQIVVMNNGMIDQVGTHEELIKSNKIYQDVYHTQSSLGGNK